MASIDKQVTIKGSEAVVASLQLYPQEDGSVVAVITGGTKDSEGNVVGLAEAKGRVQMRDPAINLLFQIARQALRQENGLDDEPVKVLQPLETAQPEGQAGVVK